MEEALGWRKPRGRSQASSSSSETTLRGHTEAGVGWTQGGWVGLQEEVGKGWKGVSQLEGTVYEKAPSRETGPKEPKKDGMAEVKIYE